VFNYAGIEGAFCKGLWAESASTATFYDTTIVKTSQNKSSLELMFKEKAKESKSLQKFGEVCVAATKNKIQGKLSDRGSVCVFVGYPSNDASDIYILLNLKTNHVIKSRDAIWSNNTYGEWMKSKDHPKMTEDGLSDTEFEFDSHPEPKELESSDKTLETAQNKKSLKQISKLKSWFNPDPSKLMEVQDSGRDLVV
jgi:hypothetical protein